MDRFLVCLGPGKFLSLAVVGSISNTETCADMDRETVGYVFAILC